MKQLLRYWKKPCPRAPWLLWFSCEICPIGSCVCAFGLLLVVVFWKVMEPFGNEVLLEEVHHQGTTDEHNGLPCALAVILSSWIDCIHSGTEPRQGPFSLRLHSSVDPITKAEMQPRKGLYIQMTHNYWQHVFGVTCVLHTHLYACEHILSQGGYINRGPACCQN